MIAIRISRCEVGNILFSIYRKNYLSTTSLDRLFFVLLRHDPSIIYTLSILLSDND